MNRNLARFWRGWLKKVQPIGVVEAAAVCSHAVTVECAKSTRKTDSRRIDDTGRKVPRIMRHREERVGLDLDGGKRPNRAGKKRPHFLRVDVGI